MQYWGDRAPPAQVTAMVDSWRAAPGFDHQLYDKMAALRFLREHFGPRWVSAFRLARYPAQEADLFRLCALAHSGGIYADADDVLLGGLDDLVQGPGARGLILYREPLGGILGNNFIAAPPGHPAIIQAARMACAGLLQRSNEAIWNSTGPGLLTRAVAAYIARTDPAELSRELTLLDWPDVAGRVLMHNTVTYKSTAQHWNTDVPPPEIGVWQELCTRLEVMRTATAGAPDMPAKRPGR